MCWEDSDLLAHGRRRQPIHPLLPCSCILLTSRSSPEMPSLRGCRRFIKGASSIVPIPILLLLLVTFIPPVRSARSLGESQKANRTLRPQLELQRLKSTARAHLETLNKPSVKTIQSPDGDIIDCVHSHKQPAFDHPLLKGQKPLDPPERPNGQSRVGSMAETFQSWARSGERCPEGTVPIRRTTEEDVMRASSVKMFGRKVKRRVVRRDSSSDGHEVWLCLLFFL